VSPLALQRIIRLIGNAGLGVQVRTVCAVFHESAVFNCPNVVESKNVTPVRSGSISSLNVITKPADGETPVARFAGIVETTVGAVCAWASSESAAHTAQVEAKSVDVFIRCPARLNFHPSCARLQFSDVRRPCLQIPNPDQRR